MQATPLAEGEVIRELIEAYRLSAKVQPEAAYCGSWSLGAQGARRCAFHFVTRGACWLHLARRAPIRLDAGDFAMVPRDAAHVLCGSPTQPARIPAATGADGEVGITCGFFEFGDARSNPLLEALPEALIVRPRDQSERGQIGALVGLLAEQARSGSVPEKLAEALLALVLRVHLDALQQQKPGAEQRGLFAALTDPRIGRALAAVHRETERHWRLQALAGLAGMSRTAFAGAFTKRVGVPPMHYVAMLRMRRAAALLRDPRSSVGAVAARMGYRSEAAFRRAFKRLEGSAPGVVRRAAS